MIGFVIKIKRLLALSQRLEAVEVELNEIEIKVQKSNKQYSKEFEEKIQQITLYYTKNLDDLSMKLPSIIKELRQSVESIELRLEKIVPDEEK